MKAMPLVCIGRSSSLTCHRMGSSPDICIICIQNGSRPGCCESSLLLFLCQDNYVAIPNKRYSGMCLDHSIFLDLNHSIFQCVRVHTHTHTHKNIHTIHLSINKKVKTLLLKGVFGGASEMAQAAEDPTHKSDNLCSIPGPKCGRRQMIPMICVL